MSDGWIKMHRSIRDNWIWSDPEYLRAWLDLLMMANWKDNKRLYKGVLITQHRGEIITTERTLAERWAWSRSKLKRFLALLEKDGMVSQKRTKNGTTLTVEKYAFYQDEQTTEEPQKDHRKTTEEPQKDHRKTTTEEIKESKKELYKKAEEKPAAPPSKEEVQRRLAELRARRDAVNEEWRNNK